MAVVIDKDGSTLVALLGKFALQLRIKTHFVGIIWLTETHSPGLVAMKTL
jgi:hypothetical protein